MKTVTKQESQVAQYDLQDLWPIVLVFIVTGIGVAYGLDVLTDIKSDFDTDGNASTRSVEENATQDAIDAVAKFPEKMGILATVLIASIVIGVLIKAFMTNNDR